MEEDNLLKKRIEGAPEQIRDYLKGNHWTNVVKEVCQKNNFSQDQLSSLENETLFILIGFDVQKNFAKNVEENLNVPSVLANDIYKEFQSRIFSQFKDILPAEIEGESENILIKRAGMLIEDVAGNKDNASPTPIKPANPVPGNSFQNTLASQAPNAVAPVTENVVVKKQYPGQDPYREPPKP